jgi:phospho-N-acetylmuramoyl-pentapeptide-transferase
MSTEFISAILISFAISVLLCPIFIPFLKKLKFGQYIREEGPEAHKSKSGTPTMGGLVILLSVTVTCLVFIKGNTQILPVLFLTLGFGLIGFLDDYIKVVMKRNLGLRAWQKMLLQIIVTGIFIYYIMNHTDVGTEIIIPFTGGATWNVGVLFIPFIFVVVVGTVNGANFTDGLDGLATSVTLIITVFFAMVAMMTKSGLDPITGAVTGALLGFFLFNVHPARVFMGDTGSLALGGFVAGTAIMLKMPLFLIMVAFIYFFEVVSVIIQVVYFKLTHGKRFFKMAPVHHHFELCGYAETQVVAGFAITTAILCLIAYLAL